LCNVCEFVSGYKITHSAQGYTPAVRSQPALRPFTESDNTRGCNNTICRPEEEQGTA